MDFIVVPGIWFYLFSLNSLHIGEQYMHILLRKMEFPTESPLNKRYLHNYLRAFV